MDFVRKKTPVDPATNVPDWREPGQPFVEEDAVGEPLPDMSGWPYTSRLYAPGFKKKGFWAKLWAWLRQLYDKGSALFNLYGGLVIGFLVFYISADYTSFMAGEQRPGQLIFSNTMTQLWTASFRMTFVLGFSLALLRLFWPELFAFFRPDDTRDPDLNKTIRLDLTSFQRICVFLLAFLGFCYLFILLLSVNLPTGVSVGR